MKKTNKSEKYADASNKYVLAKCIKSITEMDYSDMELHKIIEFYLLQAPVMTEKKADCFGHKRLKDYGWNGNGDMTNLEKSLLNMAGMDSFNFIKAPEIKKTLEKVNLNDEICFEYPRAVLQQKYKIKIEEGGSVSIPNGETKMECLFRHVRNSLAHNRTYYKNRHLLLEDFDEKSNKVTARILIHRDTLLSWIKVITRQDNIQTDLKCAESFSNRAEERSA